MQLTEEQLLAAYKRMRDIREFEDRLHDENNTGDIPIRANLRLKLLKYIIIIA